MTTPGHHHLAVAAALALTAASLTAADGPPPAPEEDRRAIKAMAGEFHVKFRFHETAVFQPGLATAAPYSEDAHELVVVVRDEPRRVELQHLLVHEGGAIKHWRQVWQYEDRRVCEYRGGETWVIRELGEDEARGTWTQQVTQIDDSPRYEGVGRWTHAGGVSQWTSGDTWRPLPRRELKRSAEYQVITGTNRHTLTASGWIHEQDNTKTVLRDGRPVGAVSREVGTNAYERTTAATATDFTAARKLWETEGTFWNAVLAHWDSLQAERNTIRLADPAQLKALHKAVEALSRQKDVPPATVAETINRFLAAR